MILLEKTQFSSIFLVKSQPHRIHGAGIYANITGYIDRIHGAPYIAAPWLRRIPPGEFAPGPRQWKNMGNS
jgi:hypothetical protein